MQVFLKDLSPKSLQRLDGRTGLGFELFFPMKNTGVSIVLFVPNKNTSSLSM